MNNGSGNIGTAKMDSDGTVRMMLRAEDPATKTIGDTLISYKPGDKSYQDVLSHLGGLKPGEIKFVPPWPENQ